MNLKDHTHNIAVDSALETQGGSRYLYTTQRISSGCGSKSVGVEAFPVKGQGDGNAVVKRSGGVGDVALLF